MGIAKKVFKGLGMAGLVVVAWAWSRDDKVYMCRPGDASNCKEAQFGTFSSEFLCAQAAEAFCFHEHYQFGNKGAFACIRRGETLRVAFCNETEVEVRSQWGPVTKTRYP